MITALLLALFFLISGLFFSRGKGASLIAGYNTASPLKKAEIDPLALSKSLARVMFVAAFANILLAAGIYFERQWLTHVSIGLIVLGAIITVYCINRPASKH